MPSRPAFLRSEVFRQLEAMSGLPSPKGAALALLRLAQKEDVTLAEMAHVVQTDPALVARLIKVANSSQTGAHRPVAAVQDAMVVLGMRTVRYLALSFSLVSDHRHGRCAAFDYGRFWSHALAFGVAARVFAEETRCAPAEEMFSIGLLARIGELALATVYPQRYDEVLGAVRRGTRPLVELEQEAFGLTHGELAAAMLADWGLPELFIAPVFHHERPEEADFESDTRAHKVLWTLVLARRTADVCVATDDERSAILAPLWLAGSRFGLERDALDGLCDRVVEEWQTWAALLAVDSQSVPPFAQLAERRESTPDKGGGEPSMLQAPLRVLLLAASEVAEKLSPWFAGGEWVVQRVGDPELVLAQALEGQPELIILDAALVGEKGSTLLRQLRETRIGRGIQVLLLSDVLDDVVPMGGCEEGVDDVLPRFPPEILLRARLRAARRLILLQREVERDREEIQRFAAELAVANRRLEQAAMTDVLTDLPNRRYALDRFQQEWRAASRTRAPLSCLLIDVDHFKQINDRFGHDVGDRVLQEIAQTMRRHLRARDVLCRYAGDEFLVISPETPLVEAQACAERLRRAVAALRWEIGGVAIGATLSIGLACRTPETPDIDSLIRQADRGAYQAKESGRNKVAVVQ